MAAKDDLAKAEAALDKGVQSYSFEGKTYSLTTLKNDLIPLLEKRAKSETKKAAEEAKKAASRSVVEAQKSVDAAQKKFDAAVKRFVEKGTISEAEVNRRRLDLQQKQDILARLSARPIVSPAKPTVTTPSADGTFVPPVPMGVVPTGSATGATGGTGGIGGVGGAGTPAKPGKAEQPAATTGSIFDELAALFPAYRDWTEQAATAYFGADLIDVFRKASTGFFGVGKEKDTAAIKRAIEGTNYWRTTTAAIQKWDGLREPDRQTLIKNQKELLAQTFGELQLDDATLTELATTIQRTGLTEIGASQLVYGAAFKRAPTETGPQSRQLALESEKADQLRKIARAYGYSPKDLDAQIESVLTGQSYLGGPALTDAALRERAEKLARGAFPHLKDQFDSGLTLEDMFGNYRDIASRVLEVDPATVDFMKDPQKWLKPFGDAKTGQMSLSDWVRELKTNKDYGWRFTNQANQQVSSVVSTLERAFGLIK